MNLKLFSCLGVFMLTLAGCGIQGEPVSRDLGNRKIRAVTTTTMITDAVKVVGGERVEVDALMEPGVDPHQYQPTADHTGQMQKADVVFYHGLHLEGKMGDVFRKASKQVKTVPVAECLDREKDLRPAPEGYEGTHDPHVWFDVTLWMKVIENIRDTFVDMDPAHAQVYRDNTAKYLSELTKLQEEVKAKLAQVPSQQRVLVTAHDAFYYFGHAYGFEVHGLQGVSTADETSITQMQKLAQFIANRKIPAIFIESSVPVKNIEALQAAVKSRGFKVEIGGELFSDSLGDYDKVEGTYVGMVRHNVDTIVQALTR